MGGLFGRNQAPANDPFYNTVSPLAPSPASPPASPPALPPASYGPGSGLGAYDPYEEYGYEYEPTSTIGNYGGPIKHRINPYGGRYAQGFNQMPGITPWNYGNYYLGNTTMQMMPLMLNKVHKYGQIQAMAALGNAGLLGSTPMMPSMPFCLPPSFSMPMAAPMMAAATPLPVAFNPLIQGMYPMASMNPVNWMTPSSFMSALISGPMPYRPPTFDFPSNVGMVMTVPYGTPNPLLSLPPFGGFGSSYNFGGGSWCCYCMPSATVSAPPAVSYYPHPVSVPPPYPVPYPATVPIPNVQQAPFPRPVAGGDQSLSASARAPLWPSQGGVKNAGFGQPAVMASYNNSTTSAPINNQPKTGSLPVYNAIDPSRFQTGQQVTSSLSNHGSNNNQHPIITPSQAKNENQLSQTYDTLSDRFHRYIPSIFRSNYNFTRRQTRSDPVLPPILRGQLISDSGWLPKTFKSQTISSIASAKIKKRSLYTTDNGKSILNSSNSHVSFIPRRRGHHSGSSASEYDCAICQEQREKRRLRDYYGSSTVSSLLSSPKGSRRYNLSSNESAFSSIPRTSTSSTQHNYKSHRRHPTRIKTKNKSPSSSSKKSSSPVLLGQIPIQEQRFNGTIHEEEHEQEEQLIGTIHEEEHKQEKQLNGTTHKEEEQVEKKSIDDNESISEKSDHYASKISLRSTDE